MYDALTSEGRRGPASGSSLSTTTPASLNSMDQATLSAIPGAHLVLAALRSVYGLCQQIRDRPRAVLQAHARLHQAFLRVASAAKHGSLPDKFRLSNYTAVLTQLKTVLEQHLRLRDLVARVVASRRLLSGLARVHHEINVLLVEYSLASTTSSLLEWKQQFAVNRQQDEKALNDTLMALLSTPTFVNKEFPSERRQALLLLELVAEFASTDSPRGHSPQLLETLKMTHRRISNLCDLHLRRVPRWFLPTSEVEFSLTEHAIGYLRGSFGSTLQRGEIYRYSYNNGGALASSSTSTVAVKCLWALPDVQYQIVEQLFARSGVSKWTKVRHPNVVTVRGACHAASPPYLVRDFTTYGGLTAYLTALETRAMQCAGPESVGKMEALTWQLLYGASRGLLHLHEQYSIVHGGLRCNNLLVDKKGRAVIADFGLYALACDARDSGLTEFFQLDVFDADAEELIRWQAPECLREHVAYRESLQSLPDIDSAMAISNTSASATSFATDVYAFGMCILEAITRTVPWAGLDISEIRNLKGNLGLLPPRPKRISSHAWTLIEKMCAADPQKRISLSEASQEIKRLGYGDRVSSRSRGNSVKDLEALEAAAIAKVENVSNSLAEASKELKQLGSSHGSTKSRGSSGVLSSRSRNSSAQDLETLDEEDVAAAVEKLSNSLNEASQDLKVLSDRSRNSSSTDLADVEQEASKKIVCVSGLLSLASQELKRFGIGDKAATGGSSRSLDLVTMAQEAIAKLWQAPSDGQATDQDSASFAVAADIVESSKDNADIAAIPSKAEGNTTLSEGMTKQPQKLTGFSAHSEASTVKQTVRRLRRQESSSSRKRRSPRALDKIIDGDSTKEFWNSLATPHPEDAGSKADANAMLPPRSREVVRSIHGPSASRNAPDVNQTTDLDVSSVRSFDSEQPEQEIDISSSPVKMASHVSSDEDDEVTVALEELTAGESSMDEDEFSADPVSMMCEFQTARSYDLEDEEESETPAHPAVALLDILKAEDQDETELVNALDTLKDDMERSTAWIVIERDGLITLMELVWRDYSEEITKLSLELLQAVAAVGTEFATALINSKVVKILLGVIKHRSSPQQVDLAASFLLELIAGDDDAKRQLWQCRGIAVMEDSLVIDRRLVQEFKSTLAKFKRSEGYRCLNDGEHHLAIDKFSEAIGLDRRRGGYYGDRSLAYMEASMFKKAADDAYRCMRYNPYDATGYLRHGMALKAMGKYKEAAVSLRKGKEVDPKFMKIQDVLGEIEALQKAKPNEGESAPVRRLTASETAKQKKKAGDDALRKKNFVLAVQCYSEALELDPRNDWIYLHRSIAHAAQGANDKAIEDASKCIRINYRQIEGYYRLALALHSAGLHDQALSTLYRGQELDPRHAGIKRFVGQLEADEAKKAGQSLPTWFKEKGYRAFQLRSFEDAIKFYTKAIEASKAEDEEVVMHCYLYRARAHQTRGDFAAAVADCSYVLERRPKNVFARLRRADSYEQQRDFHLALKDIRELVDLNPNFEDARMRLQSLEQRCRLLPGGSQPMGDVEIDL